MKKQIILTTALLLTGVISGVAMAACPGTPVADVSALLKDKTVCQISPEHSQEEHHANGELWDYKLGTNPMDPRQKIGNWSAAGTTVTYTYLGGGGTGSYTISDNGGTYNFCNGAAVVATATIVPTIANTKVCP